MRETIEVERYTPGHTSNTVDFMSKRSLESHGGFSIEFLSDGMTILDSGCGPGSITCDIAERIPNGSVVGIDADETQVMIARDFAKTRGVQNEEFRSASAYSMPFRSNSFDAVFSHALLEHLREPDSAIGEFLRVLKPGGILGVCSPDWGGFLLAPPSDQLAVAIDVYKNMQVANGGDVYVGRKLSTLLNQAGFEALEMRARYEVYDSLELIGEYLALQLEKSGETTHASTLREWSTDSNGMFAQAWVSCTGRKPVSC